MQSQMLKMGKDRHVHKHKLLETKMCNLLLFPLHILNYLTQKVTIFLLFLSSLEHETSQPLKNSKLELEKPYTFSAISEEQHVQTYSMTAAKAILPHTLNKPTS